MTRAYKGPIDTFVELRIISCTGSPRLAYKRDVWDISVRSEDFTKIISILTLFVYVFGFIELGFERF